MAESIDYAALFNCFFTYLADLVTGVAGVGACCVLCILYFGLMAERVDVVAFVTFAAGAGVCCVAFFSCRWLPLYHLP